MDHDIYLFKQGNHFNLYDKLGAHPLARSGVRGTLFAVWAPNAGRVSVVGEFNDWNRDSHPLSARWDGSGIWEGFVPGVGPGALYKYFIVSRDGNYRVDKGDPFALCWEAPPHTASVVCDLSYEWGDAQWMAGRSGANGLSAPWSVYEVHLGSWRRNVERGGGFLTYRELAEHLPAYVRDMGFSHVEFLPVMEHPFYGSWGYQTTGYFAPTGRYGTPQDFMSLVDALHQSGIGVILDWVPSHFPSDEHGLAYYDGTHLFEHEDPRKGFHPDWKTYLFNYGRSEVRSFLISSALFWLERYHADGIRIDAVASMLYLDYSRKEGEWVPNEFGGRENLEAIAFLRRLNEEVYRRFPDVQTIAEESTAWPMVSRPAYVGGLGFGMKWNMGWMHDTLAYISRDSLFRKYHHNELTFGIWYAFSENFMLSLSHDEVVYGKGSLIRKMPGDDWKKFANLRLLLGYLYTHPGKKLLFMGGEFGQWNEWDHEKSLDWHILEDTRHEALRTWMKHLNILHRAEPALHELDFVNEGFEWAVMNDAEHSTLAYLRKGTADGDQLLVVLNFTPVPRRNYRVGVPSSGYWRELLNSDARDYGGSGQGNLGGVESSPVPLYGKYHSLSITLPPLGMMVFKRERERGPA
ncbi:MAG TPA: 1,4-alpha-glucan branching protein GlgB [Nitrospirota bacterium]|nr:1,4-alpha-glucan branching protein GlgB [Nitrospirota bacterium]